MAMTLTCDGGCGTTTSDSSIFTKIGVAIQREYCPACATKAKAYVIGRDELHNKVALDWKNGLANLSTEAGLQALPDVP